MRRRAGVVVAAAALPLLLTGCSAPATACPEIGWRNSVTVQLEGDDAALERVVEVQLCDDTGCSTPQDAGVPDEPPYFTASPSGSGTWLVDVLMSAPETAEVRAFDAGRVVLGEVSATLRWVRVGGSAECGGPMRTDPVVLPVATPA